MLQDEEFEQLMLSDERVKALGFRPQKEILTNHLLPYCEELDEESNRFFAQVKTNFAKAVMLREMKPACGVWSSRLIKYIRIYGLKFGKEDHIDFIKLAYELVLIPELEPCKVQKFATLFVMLTKKKYLISPEELVLPWRPLYDLGKRLFEKNSSTIGMFHYISPKSGNQETSVLGMVRKLISGHGFDDILGLFGLAPPADESATSLDSTYMSMVNCAKPYFDVSATKEMLEVFMPYAMRWGGDNPVIGSLGFLPVGLPPKYAAQGHELWFDKLMTILDTCHNAQCGDPDIFILFANLAKKNPGAVDWTPHVPKMFTRFLHALNLPVSYKDMQHCRHLSLDMKNVAKWIVWTINPDGVILKHLRSFLAGVESYLHSANSGRWSFKLRDLLRKLAGEFLNRVRFEREKKFRETWLNKTPEAYKLRDEDITEFVMIVLEPTFQAVYSRSGSLDISIALQNLATLRPAIVIPPLIEKLRTSLTSLTEPHRVTVAMSAVAAVARPMLRGADADYPEGPRQVVPLLMAVLPGLDPNDIKKTIVTLHFILMFSCMVTYIDCSSAHEYWPDLTEDELLTCELTAQFEDFILVLLDKLFTFIESSVQEHVRLETKDSDAMKSKMDAVMETAISCAVCSVLTQCSPKIFKEALRKFKAFATETTYETNVSGSMIGALLKVFARINPEATLAAFLPQLCQELQELLASDEALHEENPPRDLVYRLVLFMEVVSCDGTVLMKYMDQILPVLDRALKLHATYALSPACDALANILSALSAMDLKEWKCLIKDYGTAPEKWLPIREWGNGCALKDVKFQWHVPSAEEAACAQMLIDRYVKAEVSRLQQWLSDERPMCRERRLRSLKIINCGFACSKFLPPPNEDPILLMESQVPATNIPFTNGVKHQVYLDGENMRVAITHLLLKVQAKMLAENTEDPRGLDLLLQVWERVIVMKNSRSGSTLEGKLRSYGALERAFDGRGGVGGKGAARLRMVLADAVRLQDEARLDLVCDAGIAPSALQALHAVYRLSVNRYSSIRRPAQSCLYRMLTNYPYSYRALIPEVVELLGSVGDDDEGHARHKGALYILLGPKMAPLIAKQDWAAIRAIWPAILRAPLSEKLSIHRLEQAFSEVLHRYFPAINTRLTVTDGSVAAAKRLLTDDQVNDPEFTEQLAKATDTEKAASANFEKVYLELINELVDIAESSSVQWRRLELVMQMLIFCASIQTPYPPRAVRLFAKCLLHENVIVRKLAQKLMFLTLKQRKRKLKKIEVDPYEVAGIERPETHIPGYRKDLEWVVWSKDKEIKTDEEWDRPWLRNHTYGFYSWPKKIEVAAPISEQNFAWDTKPEDMEEGERYIYEFFTDEENIAKLIGFFTAEEKKGKDKFNATRCTMIRFLFAHFGRRITERLIEAAVECAAKPEESKQRFAAEVACAAMRAPRYWRRHDALALQRDALRILTNGLTSVIPETQEDWGTAVATAADKMDPLRNSQLIQQLLQLCSPPPSARPAPDQETSFVASARLYAFQGALVALSWRGAPLAVEFLERLEAANYIQHPYENVRATVGSILMMIFNLEVVFPGGEPSPLAPSLQRFLDSVQPRLAALYDEKGDIVIKSAAAITSAACSSRGQVAPKAGFAMMQDFRALLHAHRDHTHTHTDPQTAQPGGSETELQLREIEEDSPLEKELTERLQTALHLTGEAVTPAHAHHERAVNLLTTVLTGCMGVVVRGVNTNLETQLKLVPLACALASRGSSQPHEELPRAAGGFLAALAQAYYRGETFDCVLTVLEELANGRSWWARLACLDFAIPLLFYGLPLLCDRPERAVRAEAFALKLMRDSRVEVRQSAAKVLTGLMHCRALPDEDKTLKSLIRSCRSKELDERHCGVLGLCAHMSSRPYSLGPRLGDVLAELAKHTNAPDPIPATIRTALADFKRTHQDDWPKHREQLTEEELDLLADLTSPPSYCA